MSKKANSANSNFKKFYIWIIRITNPFTPIRSKIIPHLSKVLWDG